MRCVACNANLTDAEASLKYLDWMSIPNTEDRYPTLCFPCVRESGLMLEGNPLASDEKYQDEEEVPIEEENETEL